MHSHIKYNCSIWQEKDWIVTRFLKFLFRKNFPEKREEANNAMTNQRRDTLGLQVCWLFSNRHWRDFSLPTDRRGNGVFGPHLAGWYEQDLTQLFFGGAGWGPLSRSIRGGQELTLMFVGISNRGPIGGSLRGSTYPSPCWPNPSSLTFWLGFSTTSTSLRSPSSLTAGGEATNS